MRHGPLKLLQVTPICHYRRRSAGNLRNRPTSDARATSRDCSTGSNCSWPRSSPTPWRRVNGRPASCSLWPLQRGCQPPSPWKTWLKTCKRDYAYLKRRFDALAGALHRAARQYMITRPDSEVVFGRASEFGSRRLLGWWPFHDREWEANIPWGARRATPEVRGLFCARPHARPQIHLQHMWLHPSVDHPYPHNYGDREDLL